MFLSYLSVAGKILHFISFILQYERCWCLSAHQCFRLSFTSLEREKLCSVLRVFLLSVSFICFPLLLYCLDEFGQADLGERCVWGVSVQPCSLPPWLCCRLISYLFSLDVSMWDTSSRLVMHEQPRSGGGIRGRKDKGRVHLWGFAEGTQQEPEFAESSQDVFSSPKLLRLMKCTGALSRILTYKNPGF